MHGAIQDVIDLALPGGTVVVLEIDFSIPYSMMHDTKESVSTTYAKAGYAKCVMYAQPQDK